MGIVLPGVPTIPRSITQRPVENVGLDNELTPDQNVRHLPLLGFLGGLPFAHYCPALNVRIRYSMALTAARINKSYLLCYRRDLQYNHVSIDNALPLRVFQSKMPT